MAEEIDQFEKDVRFLFKDDPVGRRVFENLRESYGRRSSFNNDALEMAFKEGQRAVFLELEEIVEKIYE